MRALPTNGFKFQPSLQVARANRQNTPEEGSPGRTNAPCTNLSFLAADNKRCSVEQRRLCRTGFSARLVVADLRPQMTTTTNEAERTDIGDCRTDRFSGDHQKRKPQAGVAYITVVYLLDLYCTLSPPSPTKGRGHPYPSKGCGARPYNSNQRSMGMVV